MKNHKTLKEKVEKVYPTAFCETLYNVESGIDNDGKPIEVKKFVGYFIYDGLASKDKSKGSEIGFSGINETESWYNAFKFIENKKSERLAFYKAIVYHFYPEAFCYDHFVSVFGAKFTVFEKRNFGSKFPNKLLGASVNSEFRAWKKAAKTCMKENGIKNMSYFTDPKVIKVQVEEIETYGNMEISLVNKFFSVTQSIGFNSKFEDCIDYADRIVKINPLDFIPLFYNKNNFTLLVESKNREVKEINFKKIKVDRGWRFDVKYKFHIETAGGWKLQSKLKAQDFKEGDTITLKK